MGLFDSLRNAAGNAMGAQETHDAFGQLLQQTPLGGMSGLLDQLSAGGLGGAVQAWCAGGEHPQVSPDAIRTALGDEHIQHIASSMGVSTDEVVAQLSEHLPTLAKAHADAGDN